LPGTIAELLQALEMEDDGTDAGIDRQRLKRRVEGIVWHQQIITSLAGHFIHLYGPKVTKVAEYLNIQTLSNIHICRSKQYGSFCDFCHVFVFGFLAWFLGFFCFGFFL
jgi:hypothetical protein